MDPLHIVFTFADLRVGGAEVNAVHLARILARRGHRLTVVAGDGPLVASLQEPGIRHVVRAMQLKRPWTVVQTAAELLALHSADRIDVVHAFMAAGAVPAALADLRLGQRGFAIVAAPPGFRDRHEPAIISTLRLRALAAGADVVLAPSSAFLEECLRSGVARRRLRLVPFNATMLERFAHISRPDPSYLAELGLAPEHRVLCSVARLHPTKGQDLLLRAIPQVLGVVANARLLLVGDGPWRDYLQSLAQRLGVEDAVRFAGQRSDIPRVLSVAEILIQTTFGYGGPGLSVIEAFAAGVPVVGMSFPDLEEAVGASGGAVLVRHGDVEALASAIVRVLMDRELADQMGSRARAHSIEHFDMTKVATVLEETYRQAAHSYNRADSSQVSTDART